MHQISRFMIDLAGYTSFSDWRALDSEEFQGRDEVGGDGYFVLG